MEINKSQILAGKSLPSLISRFYIVGYILFVLPWTREWFVSVTALSLVLVMAIMLYYHRDWRIKNTVWFLFIIFSSFLLEVKGVSSGDIFGQYTYGEALGYKIKGVPLIIGFNWLFLVYASRDIVINQIKLNNPAVRIFAGAALMIGYDLLLEWVAPFMQMWSFSSGFPPLTNFTTWFIAGLIYHSGFEFLHIYTNNMPVRWLFIIQWIFFLMIAMYSLLFL